MHSGHGPVLRSSAFGVRAGCIGSARSAGTTYYVHLMLDGSQMPGSSQIFNNHIPLDPQLPARSRSPRRRRWST
jgi:hypothetical protein